MAIDHARPGSLVGKCERQASVKEHLDLAFAESLRRASERMQRMVVTLLEHTIDSSVKFERLLFKEDEAGVLKAREDVLTDCSAPHHAQCDYLAAASRLRRASDYVSCVALSTMYYCLSQSLHAPPFSLLRL